YSFPTRRSSDLLKKDAWFSYFFWGVWCHFRLLVGTLVGCFHCRIHHNHAGFTVFIYLFIRSKQRSYCRNVSRKTTTYGSIFIDLLTSFKKSFRSSRATCKSFTRTYQLATS